MNKSTERLIYDEGPKEAAEIIRKNCPARITVMFAPQNYLYAGCSELLSRMYNTMVVELTDHSSLSRPLFFSDFICGYLGTGPAKTEELLLALGVEADEAEDLACYSNGFQLSFDQNGNLIKSETKKGFPIEIRSKQHIRSGKTFYVPTDMLVVDYVERNMFFLDINDSESFVALLNAVASVELEFIDYYIGNDSIQEIALPYIPLELDRRERRRSGYTRNLLNGPYICFNGKSFKITAFINDAIAMSVINNLVSLFAGHEVFEEKRIGRYGAFLKDSHKRKKEGISGRVYISKSLLSSRKWSMFR